MVMRKGSGLARGAIFNLTVLFNFVGNLWTRYMSHQMNAVCFKAWECFLTNVADYVLTIFNAVLKKACSGLQ
eukprot:3758887-Karenia_brevis.AAC.1